MIGLDAMVGVEAGAAPGAGAIKWGAGGEGDQGPPTPDFTTEKATEAEAPKKGAKPAKKTAAKKASTALVKSDAEDEDDEERGGGKSGGGSRTWLIAGGFAAAIVGALIFFFSGGPSRVRG